MRYQKMAVKQCIIIFLVIVYVISWTEADSVGNSVQNHGQRAEKGKSLTAMF